MMNLPGGQHFGAPQELQGSVPGLLAMPIEDPKLIEHSEDLASEYVSLGPWIQPDALPFYVGRTVRLPVQGTPNPQVVIMMNQQPIEIEQPDDEPRRIPNGTITLSIFEVLPGPKIRRAYFEDFGTCVDIPREAAQIQQDMCSLHIAAEGFSFFKFLTGEAEMHNQFPHLPYEIDSTPVLIGHPPQVKALT
ncbi:unnamed protein product [Amoebophrya sp. A25]|nr:unnamed protein product [Amoebophrya sp. A25]|eukprot:GSA25T00017528001.1